MRLAILVSGSGRTLQNLIDRIADGSLKASIEIVIGSREGLQAESRAQSASVDYEIIDRKSFRNIDEFSTRIFDRCDQSKVDLVCLAGWLCRLKIPNRYENRVINIHPSLLPKFGGKGMFGLRVHEAVLAARETESGCTVHFVNDEYDAGAIVLQRRCPVMSDDTVESLARRVFVEECLAYPEAIELVSRQFAVASRQNSNWRLATGD